MRKLFKILRTCFGITALLYGLAAFGTIPNLFRNLRDQQAILQPGPYPSPPWWAVLGLQSLAGMILLSPLVIACFYSAAWLTLWLGKPSGRRWAIAASTAMLATDAFLAIGVLFASIYLPDRGDPGIMALLVGLTAVIWLPQAALGVVGLVAFWREDVWLEGQAALRRPPRVSGDGTNLLFDVVAFVVGLAGFLAGLHYWVVSSPSGIPVWISTLGPHHWVFDYLSCP